MNEHIRFSLKKLDPFPKSILDDLWKRGIKTGSKVFGGFDPETSDVDWLIPPEFHLTPKMTMRYNYAWLEGGGSIDEENTIFHSIYVRTGNWESDPDRIYNLLFLNDEETFEIWKQATIEMRFLIRHNERIRRNVQDNKTVRVELFETLKRSMTFDLPRRKK
jgi:hypothetical protein